jgi:ABC-type transport system substrate-binding protein
MKSRRVRAALAMVATAGALSGCTPASEPLAAITLRDQRPTVLLYACSTMSQASIYPVDGTPADRDTQWSAQSTTAVADSVVELPVFGPAPSGWKAGLPDGLTLRDGVRYHLGGLSNREARIVEFTVADLGRLGADQVLTADGPVARSAFTERARKGCP